MRVTEIGQQLRAYRLESGLRADEIATQLGVSRAALYRYEKGDVIKLDTIQRLAEMLKISPLSLLGIGVEYYQRPVALFERLRQMEETADQILTHDGGLCYLTTTAGFDAALSEMFADAADNLDGEAGAALRAASGQVLGVLAARRKLYGQRRPGIVGMIAEARIGLLLRHGIAPSLPLSERMRRQSRAVAEAETDAAAALMETEPMAVQFGVLPGGDYAGGFHILRGRDRATIAINPFGADAHPSQPGGIAMMTTADEAIATHQRVAESQWPRALKGRAGAARLRELVAASRGLGS